MRIFIRKILVLLLLTIYVTNLFQIVSPLINYAFNYNYIVDELCKQKEIEENDCKGSCYLNKQLVEKSNTEEKANTAKVVVKFENYSPHLPNKNSCKLKNYSAEKDIIISYNNIISIFVLPPLTPPPEFI